MIALTFLPASWVRRLVLAPDDLLRDATYRRLWISFISSFGGQVTLLALPLTAAVLLHATPTQMGIFVCILLIATALPVVGIPIQIVQEDSSDINPQRYQALTSEFTSNLSLETFLDIQTAREHPEKTPASMNDVVINMIEQVDETIYLRYLENLTDFGPRVTGGEPCKAAAEYIYNQFDSMGLAVRYHHSRVDNVEDNYLWDE